MTFSELSAERYVFVLKFCRQPKYISYQAPVAKVGALRDGDVSLFVCLSLDLLAIAKFLVMYNYVHYQNKLPSKAVGLICGWFYLSHTIWCMVNKYYY